MSRQFFPSALQRPRRPVIDPGPPPDLGPLAQWVVGQERDDPTRGPEGLTGLSAQQQAHLAVHKDWDPFHELQYVSPSYYESDCPTPDDRLTVPHAWHLKHHNMLAL